MQIVKFLDSLKRWLITPLTLVFLSLGVIIILSSVLVFQLSKNRREPTNNYRTVATRHFLIDQQVQPAQPGALAPCLGQGSYNAYDGKIYYQFINSSCHPVEGGYDAATFEVLNYGFARDKDKGFYEGQAIEIRSSGTIYPQEVKTDGATFEALADGYARDKNHVYFFSMKAISTERLSTEPTRPRLRL